MCPESSASGPSVLFELSVMSHVRGDARCHIDPKHKAQSQSARLLRMLREILKIILILHIHIVASSVLHHP